MMGRAERRRLERQLGKHRAEAKKGHRSPIRKTIEPEPEEMFSALQQAGFQIAAPRIIKPGEQDGSR